jgi:hypothetical protein
MRRVGRYVLSTVALILAPDDPNRIAPSIYEFKPTNAGRMLALDMPAGAPYGFCSG